MGPRYGEVFAGYTIVRRLGSGPVGDVFLATHDGTPTQVALKIASTTMAADRAFCGRFARNTGFALRVSHPNMVAVYDFGEFEGRPWVASEYADGGDAGHLAASYRPGGVPERDVCAIVAAVAAALDHLHREGSWHRGVKPSNILLTEPNGGERRILLSDFLTGESLRASGSDAEMLDAFAYLAPEALRDPGYDHRVDQYALAGTAFHLFTGSAPHPGEDLDSVVTHMLMAPPPLPGDRRPELAHLDEAFATALAKNPDDRFACCGDFAVELARAAGQV
jgi:serine/threonine protein kinase